MNVLTKNTPKVFISYSWKPITNKNKTIELAERLTSDGIHVIIDIWDLAEGQDKYQFMEKMVNDNEINRVLIICNNDYKDKANKRKGGVGTESLIISDEIYDQADQKKFIPIILERDDSGKEFVPTFINSRIYIDLSSEDIFEDEYEKLLRNIFDKPTNRRPPIGEIPGYLNEDEITFLRTAHKIQSIKNALVNEKSNYQILINDYYKTFIISLKDFEVLEKKPDEFIDELIINKISNLKFLRDDFINFFDLVCKYGHLFDIEKFQSFINKLAEYILEIESHVYNTNSFEYLRFDHFRFFLNELFLYMMVIMIENELYKELSIILNNPLILINKNTGKVEILSFTCFNHIAKTIERDRNNRLNLNRVSLTADLLKQRADNGAYGFEKIQEADSLLYYIYLLSKKKNPENPYDYSYWFPHSTIYNISSLPLFERLISKRHFEKIKLLFDVDTIEELKSKVEKIIGEGIDELARYPQYRIPYLKKAFDFSIIGKYN